jgi:hypothetical protein
MKTYQGVVRPIHFLALNKGIWMIPPVAKRVQMMRGVVSVIVRIAIALRLVSTQRCVRKG